METLETTIVLRKAKLWDVFHNGFNKRLGQAFWVKSQQTGRFDNRCYIVENFTNAKELKAWVEQGMLYVPASDLEIRDFKRQQEKTINNEQLTISA